MGIAIESLTLQTKGNVVKNNDENGDTILRMTQDQAWEIYTDLGQFFDRNPSPPVSRTPVAQDGPQQSLKSVPSGNVEAGIQHDGVKA